MNDAPDPTDIIGTGSGLSIIQVEELKGTHCHTLSNDLRVISHTFPGQRQDIVNLVVKLRDTRIEKVGGLAHLAEHLLVRWVDKQLAAISPVEVSGRTNFDAIILSVQTMHRDLPSVTRALLSTFSSIDAVVTTELIEAERPAVKAELEAVETDIDQVLQRMIWQMAFRVHAYGAGDPGGDLETTLRVSQDELRAYCRQVLQPSRCSVIMTGGFDDDDEPAKLVLSCWPRRASGYAGQAL
jgi:predicted Zn-dependent peptidase